MERTTVCNPSLKKICFFTKVYNFPHNIKNTERSIFVCLLDFIYLFERDRERTGEGIETKGE